MLYLIDITLGRLKDDILHIQLIQTGEEIGSCLNNICHDFIMQGSILFVLPGCQVVDSADACFLCALEVWLL